MKEKANSTLTSLGAKNEMCVRFAIDFRFQVLGIDPNSKLPQLNLETILTSRTHRNLTRVTSDLHCGRIGKMDESCFYARGGELVGEVRWVWWGGRVRGTILKTHECPQSQYFLSRFSLPKG